MTPGAAASRRARALGPVLVVTTLVASVISSLGAPLIPTVSRQFHVPLSSAQWSLTVGLLAGAISAPVMGRLDDGPRRRPTMIGGLVLVTLGRAVAALAHGLDQLVVGRVLQGTGLGLTPLAMASARDHLPAPRVAPMIALLSVSAATGVGVGYPVSGVVADAFGLPGAFWFGTAVSAIALVCVIAVIPSVADAEPTRFGTPSALLLTGALIALLVSVAEGSTGGWSSLRTLLLFGVALSAACAAHDLRASSPLVDLRLLRRRAVLAGDACALVHRLARRLHRGRCVMNTTPPALPADLESGLRRLRLGAMRRLAPELLVVARTQRWKPEELLRTLVEAEITSRDASNAAARMKAAAFPGDQDPRRVRHRRLVGAPGHP